MFQVLISVLKAKILPIWTKLKLWTSWSFIRTKVLTKLRQLFTRLFDIRPRNKDDYYSIGNWMVSKRLAFAITIVIGLVSVYYVFFLNTPAFLKARENGVKTYYYDEIPLRFTDGRVRILAESGYLAYEGDVSKGSATGQGKLFREDGSVIYEGDFVLNKYQGQGKLFYPSGQLKYQGAFAENLYSGNGTTYRENGNKEYVGEFLNGMKEGKGVYYSSAGNKVYEGNFTKDALMYTDFLGKTTVEAGALYTGRREIYLDDEHFMVSMSDIDSAFYGRGDSENLDGTIAIEGVYGLSAGFSYQGVTYTSIQELEQIFSKPEYEGNTYITMPEAVAVHVLNQKDNFFYGDVQGDWVHTLDDVVQVEYYDENYMLYLYTFVKENLRYTFFCKDRTGEFSMYLIEQE
jgi:hypothetical protein